MWNTIAPLLGTLIGAAAALAGAFIASRHNRTKLRMDVVERRVAKLEDAQNRFAEFRASKLDIKLGEDLSSAAATAVNRGVDVAADTIRRVSHYLEAGTRESLDKRLTDIRSSVMFYLVELNGELDMGVQKQPAIGKADLVDACVHFLEDCESAIVERLAKATIELDKLAGANG